MQINDLVLGFFASFRIWTMFVCFCVKIQKFSNLYICGSSLEDFLFFPTLSVGLLDFELSHYSAHSLCLVFRHTSENPEDPALPNPG